jgi:hypothetical protein
MFQTRTGHAGLRAHDASPDSGAPTSHFHRDGASLDRARLSIALRPFCESQILYRALLSLISALFVNVVCAQEPADETHVLFQASEFPKGWEFYSAEPQVQLAENWQVRSGDKDGDDVLVCTGQPFGYLKTNSPFEDFELNLEWSYPDDPTCNSGILMCTNGDDKIWPSSIQVQLHRPSVGSIFPLGGAKVDKTAHVRSGELAIQEWHRCVVRCEGRRIDVSVNGHPVSKVTGCTPRNGSIALQSEGYEIHFRRITLKKINSR